MKKLIRLLLVGSVLTSFVSCGSGDDSSDLSLEDAILNGISKEEEKKEEKTIPRDETLYLVGFQWGAPSTFNPLNGWPAWPARYEFNLMYEPLTIYNSLTGKTEPLLARLHESTPKRISVIMNKDARWSDGKKVTGEDVKWTYDLHLTNAESPCSFIEGFISEVVLDTFYTIDSSKSKTVTDAETSLATTVSVYDTTDKEERVTFMVDVEKRNNPFAVVDNISNIPVLPKHVFEPKLKAANGEIGGMQDDLMTRAHVVSGPYNYHSHTNEKIVVERRDDYWGNKALHGGKKPAPKYIIHPIYKGNDHASSNLKHGNLDISANYMPRIWLKKEKGVQTWYDDFPYFKAGSIPMFIINCTKAPLNDKRFRRAMALSIDYEKLKTIAVTGYTDDIQPGLILPLGSEKKYINESDLKEYGATRFNINEARRLLKEAGFTSHFKDTTKTKDGKVEYGDLVCMMHGKDTVETIEIMSVAGWTDFEWMVRLAVKSMRKAGIDVRPGLVDYPRYEDAKYTGKFDLFLETPAAKLSASMPWTRFEKVMSSANWDKIGEKMYENTGRFNKPGTKEYIKAIDSLLHAIPLMTDPADIAEGYRKLNRYFMEEQPTIPLLYRPEEFYEFSTKHWTNFPVDGDNDNIPPHLPVAMAGTKLLWRIKPTKQGK